MSDPFQLRQTHPFRSASARQIEKVEVAESQLITGSLITFFGFHPSRLYTWLPDRGIERDDDSHRLGIVTLEGLDVMHEP